MLTKFYGTVCKNVWNWCETGISIMHAEAVHSAYIVIEFICYLFKLCIVYIIVNAVYVPKFS